MVKCMDDLFWYVHLGVRFMNILGWRICHRVRVVNFFVLQMVGEQIAFSFHSCLESIIWDGFGVGGTNVVSVRNLNYIMGFSII